MKKKLSPFFVGFIQALLVFLYCGFVASIIRNGEQWFGRFTDPFLAILMFLLLLCTSVFLCALFVGAYPLYLYLADPKENLKRVLRIAAASGVWLLVFLFAFLFLLWLL